MLPRAARTLIRIRRCGSTEPALLTPPACGDSRGLDEQYSSPARRYPFEEQWRPLVATLLMVTHSPEIAAHADRRLLLGPQGITEA